MTTTIQGKSNPNNPSSSSSSSSSNKHFVPAHEKHITVTFSLSPVVISQINKECGYARGNRSKWAEAVFREKLKI